MRVFKFILTFLMTGGIVFLSLSCVGTTGATPTPTPQIVAVKRGNIAISVTGTGNLALKSKQELSFGQTGIATQATTAKISEVDVIAGQTVKQGQVLVKADTTDYQDQLTTDQHNLDSAKAAVAQAQANVPQAQLTLAQDQAALLKAQQTLGAQQDVQNIQNQIDNVNIQLQQANIMLEQARNASDAAQAQFWASQIGYLSISTNPSSKNPDGGKLGILQKQMSDLLTDPVHAGASLVSSGANGAAQIQGDVLSVQQAQAKLVTDQANISIAQTNVVLAQNKLDDAQTTLNNDKNSAQEIDAPYDGLITQVNVTQGAIVQRNATLIEIADPSKFVANILVTERDVLSLQVGASAIVSINASSGYSLPAKITQIAPLATVQQGVVNYQVAVELSSLTPVGAFPGASGTPSSSRVPGTSPAGTPSSAPQTSPSPTGTPTPATGGTPPSGTSQSITLKDGLSVTVIIPIQSKTNILILSSRAITRQGQNSTVQKVSGATTVATVVQTGITDGTNTEIVSGLNEGDQVSIQARTAATTAPGIPGGGGIRIP